MSSKRRRPAPRRRRAKRKAVSMELAAFGIGGVIFIGSVGYVLALMAGATSLQRGPEVPIPVR